MWLALASIWGDRATEGCEGCVASECTDVGGFRGCVACEGVYVRSPDQLEPSERHVCMQILLAS